MKVIYIAGKYRGPNAWAIEQNIRAAEDLAAKVWGAGMAALCPHANSRHMEGVASDEVFLAGTLELMRRCDAVLLAHNWRDSTGAVAEVEEAKRLGIPVFGLAQKTGEPDPHALDSLRAWAVKGPMKPLPVNGCLFVHREDGRNYFIMVWGGRMLYVTDAKDVSVESMLDGRIGGVIIPAKLHTLVARGLGDNAATWRAAMRSHALSVAT